MLKLYNLNKFANLEFYPSLFVVNSNNNKKFIIEIKLSFA